MASARFQSGQNQRKKREKNSLGSQRWIIFRFPQDASHSHLNISPAEEGGGGWRREGRGGRASGCCAVSHAAVICPSQRGGDAGLYDLVPLERFKSACRPDISPPLGDNAGWAVWTFSFFFISIHSRCFQCRSERTTSCGLCFFVFCFVVFFFCTCVCRSLWNIHAATAATTISGPAAAGVFVRPSFGE